MKNSNKIINRALLILLIIIAISGLVNIILDSMDNLLHRTIPFKLKGKKIIETSDYNLSKYLNWELIDVDTTHIDFSFIRVDNQDETDRVKFLEPFSEFMINFLMPYLVKNRKEISLNLKNPTTEDYEIINFNTDKTVNIPFLFKLLGHMFLFLFVFFNSAILLLYSNKWENKLIILFLIFFFLPNPNLVYPHQITDVFEGLIYPFGGIFFFHFIQFKLKAAAKIEKIYIITGLLILAFFFIGGLNACQIVGTIWSFIWFIKGYLKLRKSIKKGNDEITIKRLYAAFKGIEIAIMSVLISMGALFVMGLIMALLNKTGFAESIVDSVSFWMISLMIIIFLPIIAFFLGIVWFLGSFTWSLLTGTVMDVTIRSTLIYSLVGVTFVVLFGMVDYVLGEALQEIFGNFIGSQFIAGFPATISLLVFFNPVKAKVEGIVDKKLNNSELKFLESTDSFTQDLSEEGVLEGFEEYICENLYDKLSVTKIALIELDKDKDCYRFNELRGSNVVENSQVNDKFSYLAANEVVKIGKLHLDSHQDISSYSLLVPIISEDSSKWWLALGKRKENIGYSKRDINALLKLANQIKLSLKFILVYEDIVEGKYLKKLLDKDNQLSNKDKEIMLLKADIEKFTQEIEPS